MSKKSERKTKKQPRTPRQPPPQARSSNTLKGILIGLVAIGLVTVAVLFGLGIIHLQ
jgi:hypothetical protein